MYQQPQGLTLGLQLAGSVHLDRLFNLSQLHWLHYKMEIILVLTHRIGALNKIKTQERTLPRSQEALTNKCWWLLEGPFRLIRSPINLGFLMLKFGMETDILLKPISSAVTSWKTNHPISLVKNKNHCTGKIGKILKKSINISKMSIYSIIFYKNT